MKIISSGDFKIICREIDHLKKLKSEFVIQHFEWFGIDPIYIITELCRVNDDDDDSSKAFRFYLLSFFIKLTGLSFYNKKGDLNAIIETHKKLKTQIPNGKLKTWVVQILDGLDFLHKRRVIHFDIKPHNIFLDDAERIKLGDLGLARNFESIRASTLIGGTLPYTSPEVIKNETFNFKTDIWSFGCVLFKMITLQMLFAEKALHTLIKDITDKELVMPSNLDADLAFVLEK
jgi:serine/threonine protein kinase